MKVIYPKQISKKGIMLKRYILMALFCLSVNTYANDSLEIAIKNSELETTAEFLNTTEISQSKLLYFINLAQEIINQRKSTWEIYALNFGINPVVTTKNLVYLKKLRMKVKIGIIIGMPIALLMVLCCFPLILWIPILGLWGYFSLQDIDGRTQSVKGVLELKQEYDNAIAIKGLLMKSYAS